MGQGQFSYSVVGDIFDFFFLLKREKDDLNSEFLVEIVKMFYRKTWSERCLYASLPKFPMVLQIQE